MNKIYRLGQMLIVTFNDTILTNQPIDLIDLLSCSLKERGKCVFLHAKTVAQSNSKIVVETLTVM